jgi:hypothetical protein
MRHLLASAGVSMPSAWFLSAMPSPDIPDNKRPWRRQALLNESEFKVCLWQQATLCVEDSLQQVELSLDATSGGVRCMGH